MESPLVSLSEFPSVDSEEVSVVHYDPTDSTLVLLYLLIAGERCADYIL
jgi:hypothetical protein